MRRDKDMLRDILFEIEGNAESAVEVRTTSNMDGEEVRRNYHFDLLCDAGLITVVDERRFYINDAPVKDNSGRVIYRMVTYRLNHEGNEFLDAVRSDTVWQRTKHIISNSVESVTLSATKAIATNLINKAIEEHTGLKL